jgi:hypothetical protein
MTNQKYLSEAELRRREAEHPARTACFNYIDTIFRATRPKRGKLETRHDRERDRAWRDLYVAFRNFADNFETAPPEFGEGVFGTLLKMLKASVDVGKLLAPDGRKGRDARQEKAAADAAVMVRVVESYLKSRPELEPKVSRKFAAEIKADIVDVLGLAKDGAGPSINAIMAALSAYKKSGLVS